MFFKMMGRNIKEKRKEKGFNIQQLADNLGVAYSTMANIESGSKKPTIEQLEKLGEMLDCYSSELIHIDYDSDEYVNLSLEEHKNILNDIKEYLNLLEEKNKERNFKAREHIRKAIELRSVGYSPTGKEFTDLDFNQILCLVDDIIQTRLGQIANSKQNK